MTFSATLTADTFEDILAPVDAIVAECKIHLTEGGFEIAAVDPANVAMVEVEARTGAFETYEASGGVIAADLERLLDAVNLADSGESLVSLDLDPETRKLQIAVDAVEYTLTLIDPDSVRQEPDVPDLDLGGRYAVEGGPFTHAVKATDLVADHVEIEGVADDELVISAQGDTDDVRVTLGQAELLSGDLDDGAVKSLFSLDYLKDITRPLATDTQTTLLLGDEFPCKLQYSLADRDIRVKNLLAPRVQSGDR